MNPIEQEAMIKKPSDQTRREILLARQWYTLREACAMKGVNYRSVINKPYLKPNAGRNYDAVVGGRKVYSMDTIATWLLEDDNTLAGKAQSV